MDIRASEISAILKEQIKNFGKEAEVSEIGQVLSVGDGIARVYGLDKVQAGEMVEFPGGIRGMALNLEADNVGVVIFGEDRGQRLGLILGGYHGAKHKPAQVCAAVQHGLERGEVALDLLQLPLVLGKLEQRDGIAPGHARHHGIVARHVIALVREQMGKARLHRVSRANRKAPALDAAGIPFQPRAYHAPPGTSTAGMCMECRIARSRLPRLGPGFVPPSP